MESRGLTAWLWLSKPQAGPKAKKKPSFWPGLFGPGLARLTALGRAKHITRFNKEGDGIRKKHMGTPTPTPSFKDQINWTSTIDIYKIYCTISINSGGTMTCDSPTKILFSVITQTERDKPSKWRRRPRKLLYLDNEPARIFGHLIISP